MNILLKENEIVDVVIDSIEQFGICVSFKKQKGLVQIPEISWNTIDIQSRMFDLYKVGDTIKVKIQNVTDDKFYCSIKDVHPENNPWRNVDAFSKGSAFDGTVHKVTDFGYFIELVEGVFGLLPIAEVRAKLKVKDKIKVKILEVDRELKKIALVEN